MDSDWNKWLHELAYSLWEGEGRPKGKQDEHWAKAEREMEVRQGHADAQTAPDDPGITTGEEPAGEKIRGTEGP